jgi:CHASE1-domain containing sensor protein
LEEIWRDIRAKRITAGLIEDNDFPDAQNISFISAQEAGLERRSEGAEGTPTDRPA